jgi:hypothetical protein
MRRRIRKIKDHLYPWYIYAARRRKAWAKAWGSYKTLSEALREAHEAYTRSRNELPTQ